MFATLLQRALEPQLISQVLTLGSKIFLRGERTALHKPHSPTLLTVCPWGPAAKERTERWAKRGEEREKTWGKCQQGRQLGRGHFNPLGNNGTHRKGLCSWGQHRRAAASCCQPAQGLCGTAARCAAAMDTSSVGPAISHQG